MRLGLRGPLSVAALADQVGRDHTTVSRQLAKLERLGLVDRPFDAADRRRNAARLTAAGRGIVQAITDVRRRLLTAALAEWSPTDRAALAALTQRFAAALVAYAASR